MNFRRRRDDSPQLDITPMIDVTFQLVLFFMVTTVFMEHPAVQIDLPRSHMDAMMETEDDLVLWVTASGEVWVDGTVVPPEALSAVLAGRAVEDPTVVVKADRLAQHGVVVEIMDLAREAGLHRFALATERPVTH